MSKEEAIEILQYLYDRIKNPTYDFEKEALSIAIEALKKARGDNEEND